MFAALFVCGLGAAFFAASRVLRYFVGPVEFADDPFACLAAVFGGLGGAAVIAAAVHGG